MVKEINYAKSAQSDLIAPKDATNNNSKEIIQEKEENKFQLEFAPMAPEKELETCRICKTEVNNQDNPLISPCKCSGSIKYIHVNCMKLWYQSKLLSKTTNYVSTYTIKGLECELCKTKLSLKFMNNGLQIDLLDVKSSINSSYLVLESNTPGILKEVLVITIPEDRTLRIVFY